MTDPMAEMVALLQPRAASSKLVEASGTWRVRRAETGRPFYVAVAQGTARLAIDGGEWTELKMGDFVLVPAMHDFEMSSPGARCDNAETVPTELAPGHVRLGAPDGPAEIRMLVGYCTFGSNDAALLVPLLPQFVHIRGEPRLTTLVQLVAEESLGLRPARDVILSRLLEVLLIEALRSTGEMGESQGLLRGLGDDRLAIALRRMHERPTGPWTVLELAREAGLSRSAFFNRFRCALGVSPMEYLLHWRMALAKDLLFRKQGSISEIATRVGYSSASTFSVAFTRHVGVPPTHYARAPKADLEASPPR